MNLELSKLGEKYVHEDLGYMSLQQQVKGHITLGIPGVGRIRNNLRVPLSIDRKPPLPGVYFTMSIHYSLTGKP